MCRLHGVIVWEGTDLGDALLRHLFTGACGLWRDEGGHIACGDVCRGLQGLSEIVSTLISIVLRQDERYPTERLSKIARAIGLVSSGAKVERRKLVSMLEQFRQGCCTDTLSVEPEGLFSSFERMDRGTLLSVGFVHGLILTGGMEGMRDAIMFHVTTGACALHSRSKHPQCVLIVRRYLTDTDEEQRDVLQLWILGATCPFIKQLPLRQLLRLHAVAFEPTMSLSKLRRCLRMYVDRLV